MKTTIKALLVITTFAFFACNKTDNITAIDPTSTDLSVTQLKSASLTVNDVAVESVADQASFETDFYAGYEHLLRQLAHFSGKKGNLLKGHGYFHYAEGQVPVVSIDTAAAGYPITISIDYGTGIKTKQGRMIAGKVTIEINGAKNTDGSSRLVTYTGCVIDTIGIDGTSSETFNGDNLTTRKITAASSVKFTLPGGIVINRIGNNVRDWLTGVGTPDPADDKIQITGKIDVTSTLTDATGNVTTDTYAREITTPLIRLGDCKHPVSGIVTYSKNSAVIATLDYGDGTCDNLAKLTTEPDGTIIDIVLHGEGKDKMPKAKTEGKHKGMENGGMHNSGMGKGKGK